MAHADAKKRCLARIVQEDIGFGFGSSTEMASPSLRGTKPSLVRPKNTEERRRQIVSAMLEVMARVGYARATMPEIARATGLSQGLLHYHFESKREILLAALDHLATEMQVRSQRFLGDATDPMSRISAFIEARLGLGEGANPHAVGAWVAISAEAAQQPEVQEIYGKIIARELDELETYVSDALAPRDDRELNAKGIAVLVYSAIQGCFQLGATTPELLERGAQSRGVILMARALIER